MTKVRRCPLTNYYGEGKVPRMVEACGATDGAGGAPCILDAGHQGPPLNMPRHSCGRRTWLDKPRPA